MRLRTCSWAPSPPAKTQIPKIRTTTTRKVNMAINAPMVPSANRCGFEHVRGQMNPRNQQSLGEFRPDARRNELAEYLAVFLDAPLAEHEDVLHGHYVAFHAGNLGNADHFAGSVAVPAHLDD